MSDIEKDIPETEEVPEEAEEISGTDEEAPVTAEETPEEEITEEDVSPEAVLEEKIKALEDAAAADKDRYLRLLAEYDNFRKRSVQEKFNASADATAKAALEVIVPMKITKRALK